MGTYCEHGELRNNCRACASRGFHLNFNYIGKIPSRTAIAARIADDIGSLVGFLHHDLINTEKANRHGAHHIATAIACLEAARSCAEFEATGHDDRAINIGD